MDDPRIDPADLRNARFPGSSRRYEAKAVDQFLRTIADRIVATNNHLDELRHKVAVAEAEAAAAPVPAERPDLSTLDDDELVRLVGDETATVLSTARRAAEEIRSKAEESASRVIREATDEAKKIVDEAKDRAVELTADAEAAHDRAVTEAEAAAERVRQEAERDAHRMLAEAREEARTLREAVESERDEARDEAARVLVEAREEGRSMVTEAKEVRTRILEDLQRRRDAARSQIERLHAGRDDLLSIYALIRAQVDEITGHLTDGEGDDLDSIEVPELPDGFVGIVGAESERVRVDTEQVDDEVDGGQDAVEAGDGYVDDTVAPGVEPSPEQEGGDEPASEADVEDEAEVEVEAEDEAETGADEAETGADEAETGADVDALFARLRAERAESVERAHEVLDEPVDVTSPTAEPTEEVTADEAEPDETSVETPATEADDAEPHDTEVHEPEVVGSPASESEQEVPEEFLAPTELLESRADVIDALDAALARRLKRHLADEQNEVLDRLRRTGATDAEDLLPDAEDHVSSYAALAAVELAGAATAGAAAVDRSANPPDVTVLAQALGSALVEPFRRRLERASVELEGDADELDERLRALYREWKVQHIGPAVHDALLSAYARGTHAAAAPDASLWWLIDPQQGPCPDAQDNALAGAVRKGEAFPTGDECPQAHPGCRCLLVVDTE